jgi:hypothetical protein
LFFKIFINKYAARRDVSVNFPDTYKLRNQKVVDGRPSFAKPSIDGGKQEEIAVIDPDFE